MIRHSSRQKNLRHAEGNSASLLGTWQAVYCYEFDAPRSRNYHVKIIGYGG
ncbi:MAG: YjbQ family protein [Desulfovibrio sp.]|nr:YjbQ family protein [Desulfovibrio sp.]